MTIKIIFFKKEPVMSAWQKPKIRSEGGNYEKKHRKNKGFAIWHFTMSLGLFPELDETQHETVATIAMAAELMQRLEVGKSAPPPANPLTTRNTKVTAKLLSQFVK